MEALQLGFRGWEGSEFRNHDRVECDGRPIEVHYRRNSLAKRYRLYVDRAGRPRVTIPRRGNRREAGEFLQRNREWLVDQLRRFETRRQQSSGWQVGTEILFRGSPCRIEVTADALSEPRLSLGDCLIPMPPRPDRTAQSNGDLRPLVERHLRRMAVAELPRHVQELAVLHGCADAVKRVTVRDQRTRWGSCSRQGTISLNWRLIQVPPTVSDYIILHELMHLREMNHSGRFWAHVQKACPDYRSAEAWLRNHPGLLG